MAGGVQSIEKDQSLVIYTTQPLHYSTCAECVKPTWRITPLLLNASTFTVGRILRETRYEESSPRTPKYDFASSIIGISIILLTGGLLLCNGFIRKRNYKRYNTSKIYVLVCFRLNYVKNSVSIRLLAFFVSFIRISISKCIYACIYYYILIHIIVYIIRYILIPSFLSLSPSHRDALQHVFTF
uniref:Uncharacterized protein n=1 Tax=Anopheles quadriannulatus TaxID=34691 RepID=A0A182XTE6_ANOQN